MTGDTQPAFRFYLTIATKLRESYDIRMFQRALNFAWQSWQSKYLSSSANILANKLNMNTTITSKIVNNILMA